MHHQPASFPANHTPSLAASHHGNYGFGNQRINQNSSAVQAPFQGYVSPPTSTPSNTFHHQPQNQSSLPYANRPSFDRGATTMQGNQFTSSAGGGNEPLQFQPSSGYPSQMTPTVQQPSNSFHPSSPARHSTCRLRRPMPEEILLMRRHKLLCSKRKSRIQGSQRLGTIRSNQHSPSR